MKTSMRGAVVLILLLSVGGERIAATRDASESPLDVTVQIHDYVHLSPAVLSTASDLVSRVYKSIGVRIDWLAPMRQEPSGGSASRRSSAPRNPPDEPSHSPIAQFTIIVLTPEMTQRGHIEEGVLGFAAVATDGGLGRIAYVIYDRVQQQASSGAIDETDLMGLVMAHEIGHLLLGPGSQGEAGLMKGRWDREDLRQFGLVTPRFSPREAEDIRAALAIESDAQASR
jgi:hypothetical protein